tara:strand:- start:461 stop:781 length:321 start_codon:yes stop_codon:yes gene_type:complete
MSEENSKEQEVAAQPQEVVEVEWEEVKELVSVRAALSQTENELARFLLQAERRKNMLVAKVEQLEAGLYQMGSQLRTQKEIDDSFTYELKLPSQVGEKGYFLRKDS